MSKFQHFVVFIKHTACNNKWSCHYKEAHVVSIKIWI